MRIHGKDFFAGVHFRGDGKAIKADRAVAFLIGMPISDVIAKAAKVNWRVELSAEECRQLSAEREASCGVGASDPDRPAA
jgi:hypothetical protein